MVAGFEVCGFFSVGVSSVDGLATAGLATGSFFLIKQYKKVRLSSSLFDNIQFFKSKGSLTVDYRFFLV